MLTQQLSDAGAVTTLGRGGSDLSATVIGAALEVQEVQVWKDVDGELSAQVEVVLKSGNLLIGHILRSSSSGRTYGSVSICFQNFTDDIISRRDCCYLDPKVKGSPYT